jgi:hypothetical protein
MKVGYVLTNEKWCAKFLLEHLKGTDHSEVLGIDGKMVLEWISEKYGEGI